MKTRKLLSQMQVGESGKVIGFIGGQQVIAELMSNGIRVGAHITKQHEPFDGAPIVVQSGLAQMPLNDSLAAKVLVEIDEL